MAGLPAGKMNFGDIDRYQVRQHFSGHAEEYDLYAKIQQQVVNRLVSLAAPWMGDFDQALEVGCGTGLLSRQVMRHYPALPLIISDLAHGMSLQASRAVPGVGVCDADALALPFSGQGFDLFLSSSVYQWLEDLPAAFAEIGRVLKPRGVLVMALFGEQTLHELRSSYRLALNGKESHEQRFPTSTEVTDALSANFDVKLMKKEYEVEWHDSVPQLLRNLKRIGAQNSNPKRPPGLASRNTMESMYRHYQERYAEDSGIPATYEVIYLVAKR